MAAPRSVDEYLAALPDDRRGVLEEMRRTIRAAAPEATETIAYGMPAFTNRGRFLVSFAAYKAHDSLFPASLAVKEALGPDLAPYLAGRGTIRFPAGGRVPATSSRGSSRSGSRRPPRGPRADRPDVGRRAPGRPCPRISHPRLGRAIRGTTRFGLYFEQEGMQGCAIAPRPMTAPGGGPVPWSPS